MSAENAPKKFPPGPVLRQESDTGIALVTGDIVSLGPLEGGGGKKKTLVIHFLKSPLYREKCMRFLP